MSFAKNVGKNINKILSSKYYRKVLDHAKQSARDAFKTSSATGDLITRASKASPQNNLKRNEKILREKYISPELRQKVLMI